MNTSSKRRITPSLVLSILALFVAIGGTSYAAVKINGKNIKARTVPGKALKNNTLTGVQINENKLGIVPKAKAAESAESAATAGDAQTLGGKTAADLAAPAAFALIHASQSGIEVPAKNAFGFGNVTVTRENTFACINGLDFQPRHAQVTTYRVGAGTTNDIPNVTLDGSNFCDGDEQVAAQMVDGQTGQPQDIMRFYIALYR